MSAGQDHEDNFRSPIQILLVDDNKEISVINCEILTDAGYEPHCAYSVAQARRWLADNDAQLIVLDELLPDGMGRDLCRELRDSGNRAPILFLTCLSGEQDEIAGLMSGGDDYLTKPYRLETFLARVAALLRRAQVYNVQTTRALRVGALTLDLLSSRAFLNGEDLLLSPKDFAVLYLLAQNQGGFLSRERIYQEVWNVPMLEKDSALKSSIYRLRRQLERHRIPMQILGSREKGYCFVPGEPV